MAQNSSPHYLCDYSAITIADKDAGITKITYRDQRTGVFLDPTGLPERTPSAADPATQAFQHSSQGQDPDRAG